MSRVERPFVGRDDEVARIRELVEQARSGTPATLVLTGEAGIGKTSLVRTALEGVGCTVVTVTGDEAESSLDLGLVDQLFQKLAPGADGIPGDAGPLQGGVELLRRLDERQAERPLVVVVDDAHLGDRPSLDAIAFAARRLVVDTVLLIVVARPPVADALPAGLLRQAEATGGVIELAGLSAEAIADFVERLEGRRPPARAAARLEAHTRGNPLHAGVLLEQVSFDALVGPGELPIPRSFRSLVLAQLATCSPAARDLAAALAVLDAPTRLADAAAVSALPEVEVPVAVDELVANGMLDVVATGAVPLVDFPHALLRSSVVSDLSIERRAELHARAAATTNGEQALRHRLASVTTPDDELALEAERSARLALAHGARGAAADLLMAAAGVAASRDLHERLVLEAAEQLLVAGRALGPWAEQIATCAGGPRKSLVDGLALMAEGQFSVAAPILRRAWELAEAGDERMVAGIAAEQLSIIAVGSLAPGDVLQWSRRALDADVGTLSATVLAHGHALAGDIAHASEEMTALIDGDAGPDRKVDARLGRGVVSLWMNHLEAAIVDLDEVTGHATEGGVLRSMNALSYLAEAKLRLGEVAEAIDVATRCASILDDLGMAWLTPLPRSVGAFALAVAGDLDRARAETAVAAEMAEVTRQVPARIWSTHASLRIAVVEQDHEVVVAIGDRICANGWHRVAQGVHHWTSAYAESLVEVGRIDDALTAIAAVEADAAVTGDRSLATDAARARARWAMATGDLALADQVFDAALALDAHLARPLERGRLELAAGAHRRRTGRRTDAAALLQSAARRFSMMGSDPWSQRCERELVACGLRPMKRSLPGAASTLSPQEREVARAVAAGRSNREVANELAISVKTVEHHLSRVYAKLGIRGRTQVAAALQADGV